MRVFLDADILIWQLRGDPRAEALLDRLASSGEELWTAATQKVEVVFHVRAGEEAATRDLFLRVRDGSPHR